MAVESGAGLMNQAIELIPTVVRALPAASEAVITASDVASDPTEKVLVPESREVTFHDDGTETRESMLPHLKEATATLSTHWEQKTNKQEYVSRVMDTAGTVLDTYEDAKSIVVTVVKIAKFLKPITEKIKKWPIIGSLAARVESIVDKVIDYDTKYGMSAKKIDDEMVAMKQNKQVAFGTPAIKVMKNVSWVPTAISAQQTYTGAKDRVVNSRVGTFWTTMAKERKKKKEEEQKKRAAHLASLATS